MYFHLVFAEVSMYGPDCSLSCQCQNEAYCDHRDGSCTCTPGWIGEHCQAPCPDGFYGQGCNSTCGCQNGGTCDSVMGDCDCPDGFMGDRCQDSCPESNNSTLWFELIWLISFYSLFIYCMITYYVTTNQWNGWLILIAY